MLLYLLARDLLLGGTIYLGMFEGLVGIRWLVIAAVWFLLLGHLAVLNSTAFANGQPDTRPPAVKSLSWAFDISVVAAFLYTGYYTTAVAYIASCLCLSLIHETKGFPLKRVAGDRLEPK